MIKELTDCHPTLSHHRLFDRKPNITHNRRKQLCLTGAQFIFPHLGHNKTVTTEEDATLNVEFRIRSQCNSSLNLLSTIDVKGPSKKQQGSETRSALVSLCMSTDRVREGPVSVSVQLTRLDCTRWSKLLTDPTMAHGRGPAIHH